MDRKLNGKNVTCVIIDEPTHIKPKLIATFNPAIEPLWVKELMKWLKDEENETEI